MKQRINPVKLTLLVVIFVDAFLFLLLLSIGYTFFNLPVRAENLGLSADNPIPSETYTEQPSATSTLEPSPTSTLEPTPTDTVVVPTQTDTSEPIVSPTLASTNTQTSTVEPSQTSSPTTAPPPDTDTPEPSLTSSPTSEPEDETDTPTPSPTYRRKTSTPTATSTKSVLSCPACYIIKDFKELIISGLYTADLLNTEEITSTLSVSITLYNEYKGVVVGKAINMVDTQPADDVMHVETPVWCIDPIAENEYWVHTVASAQDDTGKLWFVIDEWVRINFPGVATKGK